MPRPPFASGLLAACALLAAPAAGQDKPATRQEKSLDDPKSDNADKILGKWKILSGPGMGKDEMKKLEAIKAFPYMEFGAGGKLTIGVLAEDPAVQELIAKLMGGKDKFACKYKLLAGDKVEIYDLPKEFQALLGKANDKEKGVTTVKIDKDEMTMTGEDGQTGKLVRVKDTKEKDAPEKK